MHESYEGASIIITDYGPMQIKYTCSTYTVKFRTMFDLVGLFQWVMICPVPLIDDPLPCGICRHLVTCGNDCDVRTFVGLEDDDISEFSVSSSKLTALACYTTLARLEGDGADVIAVAMDDNTVQVFANNVSTCIHCSRNLF